MRVNASLAAAIIALSTGTMLPSRAATVQGDRYQPGCASTSYDVASSRFDCQGVGTLRGTWTGAVVFRSKGTVDALTGDASGTVEERLFAALANGDAGQLHFKGKFTIDGSDGILTATLTIVDGSGDFSGAIGSITLRGNTPISGGPLIGTYSGSWTDPTY